MNRETQIATTRPQKCHFLTLPPEIRNTISGYVLISASPLKLRFDPINGWLYLCVLDSSGIKLPEQRNLSITRTCKQVHYETMPIFWGSNILECGDVCELGNVLEGIGQRGRQQIGNISFHYSGIGSSQVFKLLQDCSSLDKLYIVVSEKTLVGTKKGTLDFCIANGCKQLRKIRGCKEVKVESVRYKDDRRPFSEEHVQKFENTLQDELCREKVVGKATRKTRAQGKR